MQWPHDGFQISTSLERGLNLQSRETHNKTLYVGIHERTFFFFFHNENPSNFRNVISKQPNRARNEAKESSVTGS